jgi:hypothetical protein
VGIVEDAARASEMSALATSLLVLAGCAVVGAVVAAVLFHVGSPQRAAVMPRTAGVPSGRSA